MKRLVGGDYLLDLSSIELEESEDGSTKTNITDSDVLEQLTNLKKYINNPEMAKPVWVKLKNGENDELVIARGTFSVVDTGEFEICVQLDGYKLVIFIEFTQVLNSDDEPLDDWYIDTNDAKYLFTSDAQNVKATIEDANFGDVELVGDLSVGGDLSVTGDVSGDAITGNSIIENMAGYSFETPSVEHFTQTGVYAGIVKNGNKLTLCYAVNVQQDGDLPASTISFAKFNLPSDIASKLYPTTIGTYSALDFKKVMGIKTDNTSKDIEILVSKSGNSVVYEIRWNSVSDIPTNSNMFLRIECTFLLSDNLVPQNP